MSSVYYELNMQYGVAEEELVPLKNLKWGDVQVLTDLGRRMAFSIAPHCGVTIKSSDKAKRAYYSVSTFATATCMMTARTVKEERLAG